MEVPHAGDATGEEVMEVMYARCAGLDVHKETVVACVRIVEGGEVSRSVRTFATTTASLIELGEWLEVNGCTHVAMEATGVYWKPVWQVLADSSFELVLANAAQVKNVPGRKTDVNDAAWLSELLAHGLVRASFVPEPAIQELRGLLRTRKQLVREKASHVQRLQKTLEEANIKLETVLSDVMGRSGRAMIQALIDGESDPAKLAALAHWKVRASAATLREALHGRIKRHHRFLLRLHLQQVDALDAAIAEIDREADAGLACFRDAVKQLSTIPGVSELSAQVILSEIGTDMGRFATAAHLRSWAGLCPRNDESAGKRRSTRLRRGAPWLKAMLVQCAWAAARTKATYLHAQFVRLRGRRGPKKAICAVAASILTAAYHMLKDGTFYEDLGAVHFDRRRPETQARRLVKRLAELGFSVELKPAAAVS
jgi:transposase